MTRNEEIFGPPIPKLNLPSYVWFVIPKGSEAVRVSKEMFYELPNLRRDILDAAQAIEADLEKMLSWLIFPKMSASDRKLRTDAVLRSTWCTFDSKRALFHQFIGTYIRLTETELDSIDKSIRKVIDFRNAFTHGHLHLSNPAPVLSYYKVKPLTSTLDERYLRNLESEFNKCMQNLNSIQEQLLRVEGPLEK